MLAGFGFLLRRPRLWPLALLPALLTIAFLTAGLTGALYSMHRIETALVPGPDKIGPALGFFLTLVVWIGTIISGLVLGLAVALLLSAPVLERLSLQVDALVRGETIDSSRGIGWELVQAFRGTLFFVLAAPGVFLLSLIPIVGPPLALLWGAYALAFQQTDAALARRGLDFADAAGLARLLEAGEPRLRDHRALDPDRPLRQRARHPRAGGGRDAPRPRARGPARPARRDRAPAALGGGPRGADASLAARRDLHLQRVPVPLHRHRHVRARR